MLGYPLAYWLARARPRSDHRPVPAGHAADGQHRDPRFGWIVILGRKGLVNQCSGLLGLDPVQLLYTETAVVIGLVNIFMPFMVLPLMAAIERIPPSLEEAARNLGANWCQMFRARSCRCPCPG